jgi:hypothetical protein
LSASLNTERSSFSLFTFATIFFFPTCSVTSMWRPASFCHHSLRVDLTAETLTTIFTTPAANAPTPLELSTARSSDANFMLAGIGMLNLAAYSTLE